MKKIAEYSSFFNGYQGDRTYTAAQFVEYFASFIGNGVFWGGNELKVNVYSQMDIQVLTGKAWVNGYYYKNADAPKVMTLEEAHPTMSRIDRVVLRLDLSQGGRLVFATVKKGTASNTPVAQSLTRNNGIWELGLADIRVNAGVSSISQSNITDLRLDTTYCGVVVGLIQQPNLQEIFNQYYAKYKEVETHWDTFFATTKGAWSDLKLLFQNWFAQIKVELFAQSNTDFDDWSRRSGYEKTTEFVSEGLLETIKNRVSGAVLATRTTNFLSGGSIKEVLRFNEPSLSTTRITSFTANGVKELFD